MSAARHEPEGDGLTVLTVREGEASIRDFRFDCRGETSCRVELGELLQLLERRHADIAIFLAHPNLVGSLIEELRRRGSDVPEMVIAPPSDGADAKVTVSVSLSGLSESAYPQELLARLYEALRAAQSADPGAGQPRPLHAQPSPPTDVEAPTDQAETAPTQLSITEPLPAGEGSGEAASPAAPAPSQGDASAAPPQAEALATPSPDAAPPVSGTSADSGPASESSEIDELSFRLERILNQRLQQP
jgi:hypothetical protein